ncbi:hypothetical protein J7643_10730 [bacterium]|nr:hypothetical protein [bacterium]
MPENWLDPRATIRPDPRLATLAAGGDQKAGAPAKRPEPPRLAAQSSYVPAQSTTGFYQHVREAIHSNRERREVYAKASKGASLPLSQKLISLEFLVLPLAAWFDRAAADFNKRGIPVVKGDFVSMSGVLPPETPPRHRKQASDADVRLLKGWLDDYQDATQVAIKRRDFKQVAALSVSLLDRVEQLEKKADSHFAMTKHLVESVGFAAAHGVQTHAASHGEADDLVARFLKVQAFGLSGAVSMDRDAQRLHARGIGILVNDLPAIPLREAWAQLP